ncbi:MAG TPA: cell wall metabolism sensor histidine kinase WalK [Clostridiaceae bacterium]|nr:cell wall metabolism sensor histidine kinase WalK [Clostridiaceae bacterium]
MFRTIFSKMVVMFIAVLLIGFLITGGMLYIFLDNFVTKEKTANLEKAASIVNNSFRSYLENRKNIIVQLYFEHILESMSEYTNSIIWIVDKTGHIYKSMPEMSDSTKKQYIDETGYMKLPDERQYKKVMSGQGTVKEIGNFYGFFGANESWLTVQVPFEYVNSNGEKDIIAAVFLHTPVPEVMRARSSVFRFFIVSVIAASAVSVIIAYVFSLRLSRPLKKINAAAKIVASGEFGKKLDIRSNDEIGQLANSFNHMVAALENLENMRRGFIANVSHELRTPMTSIRGFIDGILDGIIPPEKQKEYLMIVRDETDRLNRLVNDLLDLAKMEAGELNLNFKIFNINELIRRCIIKFENMIVKKEMQIEAIFETEEMYVDADSDAIERVIYNLIHNALKFTPQGGKIKIITLYQKDKVLVSVEDNGIGISSDEIDLIWERFYKSDKSRGKDKSGTGLGLAIIKNIINEHGQKIWVESELGKGSKFTFTLKRASN